MDHGFDLRVKNIENFFWNHGHSYDSLNYTAAALSPHQEATIWNGLGGNYSIAAMVYSNTRKQLLGLLQNPATGNERRIERDRLR